MIDNYTIIRNLLRFPTDYSFYFLQIVQRRKENPELTRHAKIIKSYYIDNLDYFNEKEEDVKNLCNYFNARAYFNLNVREADKMALLFNKYISEILLSKNYSALHKCYESTVGAYQQDQNRTWIIDYDWTDSKENDFLEIANIKNEINQLAPEGDKIVAEIPTKNGVHLITRPFRLDKFKSGFPHISVHKNNPTLLYIP